MYFGTNSELFRRIGNSGRYSGPAGRYCKAKPYGILDLEGYEVSHYEDIPVYSRVPKRGTYTLVLDNSHGLYKRGDKAPAFRSVKKECDGQDNSIAFPLPAYGTAVFRF